MFAWVKMAPNVFGRLLTVSTDSGEMFATNCTTENDVFAPALSLFTFSTERSNGMPEILPAISFMPSMVDNMLGIVLSVACVENWK